MKRLVFLLALMMLVQPAAGASQEFTLVDFERFPGADGVLGTADDVAAPPCANICSRLTDEFASMGLHFHSGTLFAGALFPGTVATNHFVSSTPLDLTFTRTVTAVAITSYSVWDVTMYALDASNGVIASATLRNPGTGFHLGTVGVNPGVPIHRVLVQAATCRIDEACSPIVNLDDLVLLGETDTPSSPAGDALPTVPALSPLALGLLGVAVAAVAATPAARTRRPPRSKGVEDEPR